MALENHCPSCGAQVPSNAPEGVCPQCLMKAGLENDIKASADTSHAIEAPGMKIGHYELLELIGEGGMGLVYLAEQKEPVKRKVALKIVKLGMDTRQVVARFEAERQTLALLEHPNIAHVFDAGTTDSGRPYFVMEYVKGRSITRYCDEEKLCIEKRLELFRQVCEGIHHAHQKGIIHRDIKPSNILVSIQDDKPVPKIIDFGIAKAVTQPLSEKTSYTEQGQLLGTPEYMSPEQADMAYQDVDTRSDIYSLGVLLYELLTGATPFDAKKLREGGIDHIQQVIREEEPRTPSARLTSLGDKAKAVAERRRTQIITLTRRLHRELEWIPMKAMRKDRTRRYRSASELADDIQNYINGIPLIAGPESTVYRARKFVRKHAGSVAMVALVAVAVVIGLVASIVMGCRAEQARKKEVAARKQVEQALVRAENAERIAQEQRELAEKLAEDYRRSLYFKNIALADIAHRDGSMNRVRELLDSSPEDLRGWEWYRFNHISSEQASMTLSGHSDVVFGLAVSPDGKWIASGSFDKTVKVWDAEVGVELMTFSGHEDRVGAVSFSPDGRKIASGSKDTTIKLWYAESGSELTTLRGHGDTIRSVGFSSDGKRIVSSSTDGTIKVWDVVSGEELISLRGHDGRVLDAAFSPDGKRIVSSDADDGTIKLWDASTGAELMTLQGHNGAVYSVMFSPDGKRIASGGYDKTVKVWDSENGTELMSLRGHTGFVLSSSFSPDGRQIVSGAGNKIKVWDARSGEEVITLHGHEEVVLSVVFSPDGKRIISSSADKTIKIWDTVVDREQTILGGHQLGVFPLAFSPDGKRIVSGGGPQGEFIKVWDVATGAELMTLDGHSGKYIVSVSMSPDGTRIISGGNDDTIKVWDATTGTELMSLRGHNHAVNSVDFSPDGKHIVSGSNDNTIKLWDAANGTEVTTLHGHNAGVRSVAFSPDGRQIVSGDREQTIKVWDAGAGTEVMTLRGHVSGIQEVAFSPDGARIISGSRDKTVKVWDAKAGTELLTLRGHEKRVYAVVFTPDGKRIVSGGQFGVVKVWDAVSGAEVMTLRRPGFGIAFSPDGKTMAAATGSGIVLWESGPRPDVDSSNYSSETTEKAVD